MDIDPKRPGFSGKNIIIGLLIVLILFIGLSIPGSKSQEQVVFSDETIFTDISDTELITIQKNTLLPIANLLAIQRPKAIIVTIPKPKVTDRTKMIITAYSSTPDQTDDTPFITASNSWVRKGIVANNWLPFGTRIRIPEYFGDKIFVVEDRMHWRKGNNHVDIWFPSRQEAINFGVTRTYVEILAN